MHNLIGQQFTVASSTTWGTWILTAITADGYHFESPGNESVTMTLKSTAEIEILENNRTITIS